MESSSLGAFYSRLIRRGPNRGAGRFRSSRLAFCTTCRSSGRASTAECRESRASAGWNVACSLLQRIIAALPEGTMRRRLSILIAALSLTLLTSVSIAGASRHRVVFNQWARGRPSAPSTNVVIAASRSVSQSDCHNGAGRPRKLETESDNARSLQQL